MDTEFEATYFPVIKSEIKNRLKNLTAKLVYKERLMKRYVFDVPTTVTESGKYVRVRDEGDKITLTFKNMRANGLIEDQKELEIVVDDFQKARKILSELGCVEKSYQETYREKWKLDECEVCIDTWPFLESFVEVEGDSEESVKNCSTKIGFKFSKAYFGAVDLLYIEQYGIEKKDINSAPILKFDMENPFRNRKE